MASSSNTDEREESGETYFEVAPACPKRLNTTVFLDEMGQPTRSISCRLPNGHTGACRGATLYISDACTVVHPSGIKCMQIRGHKGVHQGYIGEGMYVSFTALDVGLLTAEELSQWKARGALLGVIGIFRGEK